MFRFKFKLEFLDYNKVLDIFKNYESFEGVFKAHKKLHEIFIRIEDPRFNEDTISRLTLRDFKWYKLLHPIKMSGYKIGFVALWIPNQKSVILSLYRGRRRKNIFLS